MLSTQTCWTEAMANKQTNKILIISFAQKRIFSSDIELYPEVQVRYLNKEFYIQGWKWAYSYKEYGPVAR